MQKYTYFKTRNFSNFREHLVFIIEQYYSSQFSGHSIKETHHIFTCYNRRHILLWNCLSYKAKMGDSTIRFTVGIWNRNGFLCYVGKRISVHANAFVESCIGLLTHGKRESLLQKNDRSANCCCNNCSLIIMF